MCTKKITRPQAVLFDLDGTLLDTARDLGETLNKILIQYKLPTKSFDEYRPIASHGALGLLQLGFGSQLQSHDLPHLRQLFLDTYETHIAQYTCSFNGIEACLIQLKKLSIPWAIVTNKPAHLTDKLLPHFSVMADSQINISGDTLIVKKPNPEPLLHACKAMNVKPENCWYVGDAHRDIEAGNRANMLSIVANWGYTQDDIPVSEWQADVILENPDQLTQLLTEHT